MGVSRAAAAEPIEKRIAINMPKPRPPLRRTVATIERGTVIAASSTSSAIWHELRSVSGAIFEE